MTNKVTIIDIAKLANVSKSTISNFLNGRYGGMSETTRERIQTIIDELDYRPNRQARALKAKYSSIIGISVGDVSNSYTSRLIKGIMDRLKNTDYYTIIMDADLNHQREQHNVNKLLDEQVDGIIIQPLRESPDSYNIPDGFPVVQMDRYVTPNIWPAVVSDNISQSENLTNEIIEKGYERIIVVSPPIEASSPRTKRYQGMLNALKASKTEVTILVSSEVKDIVADDQEVWNTIKELLKQPVKTAVYAFNGGLLYGFLRFLKNEEIKVPEQVGVVGYDDGAWVELVSPGITSIVQNPTEIGYKAADIIIKNIESKNSNNDISVIESKLNIRSSL